MRSIPQVLLVAALLTIGACSRDVASPTPEALAVVDNALGPFESLGELHNAYLDFLAPRLKGSADKVQTIRSACVAFAIENRIRDVSGCYIDFAAVQARLKEARERRKGGNRLGLVGAVEPRLLRRPHQPSVRLQRVFGLIVQQPGERDLRDGAGGPRDYNLGVERASRRRLGGDKLVAILEKPVELAAVR